MYELHPAPETTSQLVGFPIASVERDLILATLDRTGGNRTHAAAILGLSIRTIRNKLAQYALAGWAIPPADGNQTG